VGSHSGEEEIAAVKPPTLNHPLPAGENPRIGFAGLAPGDNCTQRRWLSFLLFEERIEMKFSHVFSPAAALVLAAVVTATALAADVAGTWTWTTKNKKGKQQEHTLTLKVEGDKLTGELASGRRQKPTPIENGTIKGDEISFEVTTDRQGQSFTQKFAGKVEGDTLTGTATVGRNGKQRDWEAKRAK
jgi:hypothetical protein